MSAIDRDLFYIREVMKYKMSKHYNHIYFYSNEDLEQVLSQIDICNKDVLTVLASGDQLFHFYNNDARSVETFDVNKLTIYYYYIRKWTMKYLNTFYPDVDFSDQFISDLLCCVDHKDNEEVYKFWKKFLNSDKPSSNRMIFSAGINGYLKRQHSCVDIEKILKKIDENPFKFYNVDISGKVGIKGKYDIIYVSNIPDYITTGFSTYADNMYNLLNNDGIVVSTYLSKKFIPDEEKKAFIDRFLVYDIEGNDLERSGRPVAYVFKKRG